MSFGGCSHVYRAAEWSLDSLCSCTCLNVEPSVTLIHLFGSRSVNIFYARIVLNESLFCVPIAVLNRKNSFPTAAFGNWLKFMKTPACVLGTEGQTFHQGGQGNPGHRRQLALGEPTWLDLEPHQFWPPVFSSLTSVLCFILLKSLYVPCFPMFSNFPSGKVCMDKKEKQSLLSSGNFYNSMDGAGEYYAK